LFPACFVNIAVIRRCRDSLALGVGCRQSLAEHLAQVNNSPWADRQVKDIQQQRHDFAHTAPIATVQQPYQRYNTGSKGPGRYIGRTFGLDLRTTVWTSHLVVAMFHDLRLYIRKIPNLLPFNFASVRQIGFQSRLALWTDHSLVLDDFIDFAHRQQLALMAFVARLPSALAPTDRTLGTSGRVRRIARWRA
jgi:hypothetical protein